MFESEIIKAVLGDSGMTSKGTCVTSARRPCHRLNFQASSGCFASRGYRNLPALVENPVTRQWWPETLVLRIHKSENMQGGLGHDNQTRPRHTIVYAVLVTWTSNVVRLVLRIIHESSTVLVSVKPRLTDNVEEVSMSPILACSSVYHR